MYRFLMSHTKYPLIHTIIWLSSLWQNNHHWSQTLLLRPPHTYTFLHTPNTRVIPTSRILKSFLPGRKNRYIEEVSKNFQKQYLLLTAQQLQQEAQKKKQWNACLHQKYEEIDTKATQIMLATEDKFMPNFTTLRNWSTDMREAGLKIRYFQRYKNYHNDKSITIEYFKPISPIKHNSWTTHKRTGNNTAVRS